MAAKRLLADSETEADCRDSIGAPIEDREAERDHLVRRGLFFPSRLLPRRAGTGLADFPRAVGFRVGAGFQERGHHTPIAGVQGSLQRCPGEAVKRVHAGARSDQCPDDGRIGAVCRRIVKKVVLPEETRLQASGDGFIAPCSCRQR